MSSPRALEVLTTALALLLASNCVNAEEQVQIDGTTVTLSCPLGLSDTITWYKDNKKIENVNQLKYEINNYNVKDVAYYRCENQETPKKNYKFYLKLKVCANCVELSLGVTVAIIAGDLLFTGAVALGVYCFTNRKGSGPRDFVRKGMDSGGSGPPRRSGTIAPIVPEPDYAPLNPGRRDIYDRPHQKR
uniref:T-cell surface glycoprotein CD3 epsilon chain-like protein n=1 Tax=Callorhinchus milii TaxID=7868 RepID=V9L8Q5_CALMI